MSKWQHTKIKTEWMVTSNAENWEKENIIIQFKIKNGLF